MALHTILGANGTIAKELVPILLENNEQVRLVSRNPKPMAGTETFQADVLVYDDVLKALQGSAIAYLLVGLKYDIRVWKTDWPVIMTNVIKACQAVNCKLVFFDNVYMYGRVDGKMTEETPYRPLSKKGVVRAQIANKLMNEVKAGNITALIARAADFYGPNATETSIPYLLIFQKLFARKKAQAFVNADTEHSYTYTTDAARGIYMLAKRDQAFNQVWHLPTAAPPLTARQFITLAAITIHTGNKVTVIPKWMLKLGSYFNPLMRSLFEMLYQNEFDYEFDSSKFEKAFDYEPVSYERGVRKTVHWMMDQRKNLN